MNKICDIIVEQNKTDRLETMIHLEQVVNEVEVSCQEMINQCQILKQQISQRTVELRENKEHLTQMETTLQIKQLKTRQHFQQQIQHQLEQQQQQTWNNEIQIMKRTQHMIRTTIDNIKQLENQTKGNSPHT